MAIKRIIMAVVGLINENLRGGGGRGGLLRHHLHCQYGNKFLSHKSFAKSNFVCGRFGDYQNELVVWWVVIVDRNFSEQ